VDLVAEIRPGRVRALPSLKAGRKVMTKLLGMALGVALLALPMAVKAEEALSGKTITEKITGTKNSTNFGWVKIKLYSASNPCHHDRGRRHRLAMADIPVFLRQVPLREEITRPS
jgi:hypothetical protein